MHNWPKIELEEVCRNITVGFVGTMAVEYEDEGVLFLRSQNILPFSLNLEPSQLKYISKDFNQKIKKSKLYPGDIAIVRTGYPGTACVIPDGFEEVNCSDLVIVRPDKNKIDPNFLCFYINSPVGKGAIFGSLVGVAQQHFNVGAAKKMKLYLPPLPIQSKIATILSAYNELIENNNQRIKLLEEMSEEIYKEWFVRMRFPGFETAKFYNEKGQEVAQSTLGALPEAWEHKELNFFGEIITGKTPSTFNEGFFTGAIPFVKTPDMSGSPYVIETLETLSVLGANSQKKKFIPKNSLMVSCIGSAGVYALASKDCQTNQQINSIVFHEEFYSYYFFNFAKTLKQILENLGSNGATMTNVNKSKFEKMKAIYPGKELLVDFHQLVKNNFELILTLQKKNQLLQQTRDLLLPRLISGKLSVEHLTEEVVHLPMAAEPEVTFNTKRSS